MKLVNYVYVEDFTSEAVKKIAYRPSDKTLFVKMPLKKKDNKLTFGLYKYLSVDPGVFEAFAKSESKGAFFNKYIKRIHRCMKVKEY